jgi:hypothetical protein
MPEDVPIPPRRPFHRYFGLILSDQLLDSPFQVELEFDMSVKKQLLDVLVVRRMSSVRFDSSQLPDGLTDLADYNLITFKSHHEALNAWAIEELLGHYVNYRKIASDSVDEGRLLAESRFKTFAVCARRPAKLFRQIEPTRLSEGVYELLWGVRSVRVVVANELPESSQNTFVLLFSAAKKRIEYGAKGFRRRSDDISTVINELFQSYTTEGIPMPYTIDDFNMELFGRLPKAKQLKLVQSLNPEDVFQRFKPEERMQGLNPEERLKGLKPEERLKGLKPEERLQGLKPEEMLQSLSKKDIEEYLARMDPQPPPKPRKKRTSE